MSETIGSVCGDNVVLVKSCHKRTEALGRIGVWYMSAVLLHSHTVAIGSVLYWMLHLRCCVLATHSAAVKVQVAKMCSRNQP